VNPQKIKNKSSVITIALITCIGLAQPALAVTDEEFKALQEQFNQLADQVEENSQNREPGNTSITDPGHTIISGYGEMHYNNLSNGQGEDENLLDFHRFVLFVGHEFSQDIRFFSEFEIEHAHLQDTADGSSEGSLSVEQAYVQFDISEYRRIDAGVILVPIGIINETHEPATFYGVERNPVEVRIIPTTWREGGAMLSGHHASGFSYDLLISSGLDGGTNIRGGRQKVSYAVANNLAATVRGKYTGVPGLELAATFQYQDDMTQDTADDIGSATLIETHARWYVSDFTFTGLYARWDIDGSGASSTQTDIQEGAYLEASYKFNSPWGVFFRQSQWDNGGAGDTSKLQANAGFNYWPHENVVLKADYQAQNDIAGDWDGLNLGVGYQF
jgi:hypothetical protein